MLERLPKKEEEKEEDVKELVRNLMMPPPNEPAAPHRLAKAESWIYSPKAVGLDRALRAGEKPLDLADADFGGMDLSHKNLSGADFKRSYLAYVSFEGSNLQKADFKEADLRFVNFRYADLRKADLRGANLEDADLTGAVLSDAAFDEGCLIKDALLPKEIPETLEGLLLILRQIEEGEVDIHRLPKRYLKYVNLRAMDLTGLDLSGVDLSALDLTGVNLSGVVFDSRKALKMDEAEAQLRRQLAKEEEDLRRNKGRPVFKRLYDFPELFESEKREEEKKVKIGVKETAQAMTQERPSRIMPRIRIRRRVKVKT